MMDVTTRRSLLAGLAAAAAATTATGSTMPSENPALVALADDLPRVLSDFTSARDNVEWILAEWSPQWPTPPQEIFTFTSGSKRHNGLDGIGIKSDLGKDWTQVCNLGTPEIFEELFARYTKEAARAANHKSKRRMNSCLASADEAKAAIAPARAYWAEVDRITAASGIDAARARQTEAQGALHAHVDAIMTEREISLAGLVIKAQALAAWAQVGKFWRALDPKAGDWADALSAAILRQGTVNA